MNSINELINRLDPNKIICDGCGKWIDRVESQQSFNEKWYCSKCFPKHQFEKIAIPLTRRVFPTLIAKDLISVYPLDAPVGLIFKPKICYKK